MTFESGSPTTRSRPIDVYLGFEIFQEGTDLFVATPQGWADGDLKVIEAKDLPTLRKLIWRWWHNILD